MGIKSSRSSDCRSASYIRDNILIYIMECHYTKNGERYKYTFESERRLDMINYEVLETTYTYTRDTVDGTLD